MGSELGELGRSVAAILNSAPAGTFSDPYALWSNDLPAAWNWQAAVHEEALNEFPNVQVSPYFEEVVAYTAEFSDRCSAYVPTYTVACGVVKKLHTIDPSSRDVAEDSEIDDLMKLSEEVIAYLLTQEMPGYGKPLPAVTAAPAIDRDRLITRIFSSWYTVQYSRGGE